MPGLYSLMRFLHCRAVALTYRNDVGCMWLNAITKQSLRKPLSEENEIHYRTNILDVLNHPRALPSFQVQDLTAGTLLQLSHRSIRFSKQILPIAILEFYA